MLRVAFKRDHLALYYGIKFLYYSKTTWFPRLSLCHRRPSLRVQQLPNLLCDEMIPIIKPGQNAKKAFLNVSTWQNLVSSVTPYLCLPWIFIFHVCGSSPLTSGSNERDVQLNIKKSFQRQMPNTHCRPRKSLALLGGPGLCILTGSKGSCSALEDRLLQERGRVLCCLHAHTVQHPADAMHSGCSIHRQGIKITIKWFIVQSLKKENFTKKIDGRIWAFYVFLATLHGTRNFPDQGLNPTSL